MAENSQNNEQQQSSSSVKANMLGISGMVKDTNETYIPDGAWSHARNASKVTPLGDLQTLSNEESNFLCTQAPYTIIGRVHLFEDKWVIFSTNNSPTLSGQPSEIGYFEDGQCKYTTLAIDPCTPKCASGTLQGNTADLLNFSSEFLITGASKQNFDCTWGVYWADSNNVDRYISVDVSGAIPKIADSQFVQCCSVINSCHVCTPTCKIDCDQIRLASLASSPCVTCSKSRSPGSLPNGSYFATLRYTVNEQPFGDFFPPSNVQPLFTHQNLASAIQISFSGLDTVHFTEFELVIVRNINQQTTAKRIGIYSTFSTEISIDNISESLKDIPISEIPIRTPVFEKSEAIYQVGTYLTRIASTSKFDFNYQPLANRIITNWISVQYPADYYRKGGHVTSNMRDEIIPFFIRWVFDTGDRSSSYHIPGRFPLAGETAPDNTADSISPGNERYFEVTNTASFTPVLPDGTPFAPYSLPDGGLVIAQGNMSYWESTELYPDNKDFIWNLSFWQSAWALNSSLNNIPLGDFTNPIFDLCGLPIRHHKMPDNYTQGSVQFPDACNHIDAGGKNIRLIGTKFYNIVPPVDNNGIPIQGIVSYEILRGSREGNKTVIAKGMVNNTRPYVTSSGKNALYQNYPYNYTGIDPTLYDKENIPGNLSDPLLSLTIAPNSLSYSKLSLNGAPVGESIITFHSPDTQFKHPFISTNEIKKYGILLGDITGNFEDVPGHPKEKLVTNLAFYVAALVGLGEAIQSMRGRRVIKQSTLKPPSPSLDGVLATTMPWAIIGPTSGSSLPPGVAGVTLEIPVEAAAATGYATYIGTITALDASLGTQGYGVVNFLSLITGTDAYDKASGTATELAFVVPGLGGTHQTTETEVSTWYANPFSLISGAISLSYCWTLGADTVMRLIYALVPFETYAYRYLSHGFYSNNDTIDVKPGSRRYLVKDSSYLGDSRQFFAGYEINNLLRGEAVVLLANKPVSNTPFGSPVPSILRYQDIGIPTLFSSLQTIGTADLFGLGPSRANPKKEFNTFSSSFYAALIQRITNQYGQLDSIQQVPVSCPYSINPKLKQQSSGEVFGGDTYVCRYTEKNTFFYFYDWLYNQPDGYEFDYTTRYMITYPRFWADFTHYDPAQIFNLFSFSASGPANSILPSQKAYLDKVPDSGNTIFSAITGAIFGALAFVTSDSYFYLFQSGVRDFFVESEVNTEMRDWGDLPEERHYDNYTYTSLPSLFDTKIIKSENYYEYDYSLSISRLFQNFISWGNLQLRDYNPFVASSCYVTRPNRIIYSLPEHLEDRKDYWRVFLINNYRDFYSKVSAMKTIGKTGALILFKADSPIQFQSTETLSTDLETAITVGTGELFSQAQQNVTNVDISLEYGSCQDRWSIINTPFGLYYICTNQGKIFKIGGDMSRVYRGQGQLEDITYHGLKFWFKEYLPFWLLKDFPTFDVIDNPVSGIGCQAIYDNQIETIYFAKKDYRLLDQYRINQDPTLGPFQFTYIGNAQFRYIDPNGLKIIVNLGDPIYFQDASWTVSYDPKAEKGGWISFHDWHPDLNIPSKNNFLTTKANQIWRHNANRQDFCNYYGIYYSHSIEFISSTQFSVNTLRSIEYYLECYKYAPDRLDRFHLLDYNFDEAIIWNTEQVTGLLDLILTPKNNPFGRLGYPKLTPKPSFQILYSKVEQRFRFNVLEDITRDRGEFTNAQQMIWITDPNGYTRTLNINNLNYNRSPLTKKKLRHYLNHVSLSKNPPSPGSTNPVNMISKTFVEKNLLSLR